MNSNHAVSDAGFKSEHCEQAVNAGFPEFSEMPDFCSDFSLNAEEAEIADWFESSLLSDEIRAEVRGAFKDARVSRA